MTIPHNTRVAFVFGVIFLLLAALLYTVDKALGAVLLGVAILTAVLGVFDGLRNT